jgi:hypothetical protein
MVLQQDLQGVDLVNDRCVQEGDWIQITEVVASIMSKQYFGWCSEVELE